MATDEARARKHLLARRLADQDRPKGRRHGWATGTFSVWALAIYGYLVDFAVSTGKVFPSLKTIAAGVGCCRRTVIRVLATLKLLGFITWERRCVLTPAQGEKGPQVHQATNLYSFPPNDALTKLLDAWRGRQRPAEDDASHDDRQRKDAMIQGMLAWEEEQKRQAALSAWCEDSPAIAKASRAAEEAAQGPPSSRRERE